jgi:hypothetical protein
LILILILTLQRPGAFQGDAFDLPDSGCPAYATLNTNKKPAPVIQGRALFNPVEFSCKYYGVVMATLTMPAAPE